jgi:TatD DNase family protein
MLVNIHTHHNEVNGNVFSIINKHENFDQTDQNKKYSLGIHPWYIDCLSDQLSALKKYCVQTNVLAIGECGLDKICQTSFAMQMEVCEAQILLAKHVNKPLIIHCVRAFPEMVNLLKKRSVTVPVIFHDFSRSLELATELLELGYYLSFGKRALLSSNNKRLASLPLEYIFFENDNSDISIESMYDAAADIWNLSHEKLIKQMLVNTEKVFDQKLPTYTEK